MADRIVNVSWSDRREPVSDGIHSLKTECGESEVFHPRCRSSSCGEKDGSLSSDMILRRWREPSDGNRRWDEHTERDELGEQKKL